MPVVFFIQEKILETVAVSRIFLELLGRFELPKASRKRPAFAAGLNPRFAREVGSSNTIKIRKNGPSHRDEPVFGAAGQIRTADLVITNDALYRLSYSSMAVSNSFIIIA